MARKSSWNPIAFVPVQVTLISSIIYIVLFVLIILPYSTVPSPPSDPTPVQGINLTKAWLDLEFVSDGYHPIDSRRNGVVRQYLVDRIEEILQGNEVEYKTIISGVRDDYAVANETVSTAVTVFQDNLSNVTFIDDFRNEPYTCYSESENVMVYVRGEEDNTGDWWDDDNKYKGHGGVLVNAHYDSVSSGMGATDDGVGVITLLQLLSFFTQDGKQPRRGIVFLFNNGEENGLYGAHNYLRHPLSQFTHTFLNLEGAGAGGRATLFRSTDAEVTRFYASSPRPFGSSVGNDGFKRGYIRSGTDYSVFNGDNGMRGLDVAFYKPRSRYHTDQDNARETSPGSVWHMLSTSLETVKQMANYQGDEFQGAPDREGKLNIGTGSNGVWFDLFGRSFAIVSLPTMFALSVALLAAGPILFIILEVLLRRRDKWYLLAKRQYIHSSDDDQAVHFSGMRGLFRFPIAFAVATAAALASSYLVTKINPYIIYSSEYTVFAMLLSIWFALAWFFLAGADRVRPTALQRMFSLIWLYALSWVLLVATTVGENMLKLAGGYFIVVYNASVFVTLLISYIELFALPTKTEYVEHVESAEDAVEHGTARRGSQSSRSLLGPSGSRSRPSRESADDEATERTSLLRGAERQVGKTFPSMTRQRHPDTDGTLDEVDDPYLTKAYGEEQAWSSSLPSWMWIIQFLILAPINIVLVGQVALLLVAALHQYVY